MGEVDMDEYVNQLMREQGVPDDLDPEIRSQLFADLSQRVVGFLNRRLLDAMDDASIAEFNKLIDSNPADPAVVQKFVEDHVPNKERVAADALLEFRSVFLGTKAQQKE